MDRSVIKEVHIQAYCYSEKEDVGIGFGLYYDPKEDSLETIDSEWINIGMSESFWENSFEFDNGIEKAIKYLSTNNTLAYKDALFAIFGDFSISFEVDGEEIDDLWHVDINTAMYELLQEL